MPDVVINALSPEQVTAIAHAGAGPLSDLARQAGASFALTAEEAKNYGPGFVPDLLRAQAAEAAPPEEPYTAAVENIANQNPANVKVSAEDFSFFPTNTLVAFADTGEPLLDNPVDRPPYVVTSANSVGKTFKIDADLSGLSASITTGTVSTVAAPVTKTAKEVKAEAKAFPTILTATPPLPQARAPIQEANGYEQAVADGLAEHYRKQEK